MAGRAPAILDADILVLGTPVWMGQPSTVAKRVLERLDAFLGETDDAGRIDPATTGWPCVAVVGNEDGAHHVSAELFQALNDVGFTLPAGAVTYWVGEAMGSTDYKDLDHKPEKVAVDDGHGGPQRCPPGRPAGRPRLPAGLSPHPGGQTASAT